MENMSSKIRPTPKTVPDPDKCPLRTCLSFISGAWTAEIFWYLQAGARRFRDLQRDIGQVSAKVLATRLREMEENGVLSRTVLPTQPPTVEYALTDFGKKFLPIFEIIAEVGKPFIRQGKRGQTLPKHRRLG